MNLSVRFELERIDQPLILRFAGLGAEVESSLEPDLAAAAVAGTKQHQRGEKHGRRNFFVIENFNLNMSEMFMSPELYNRSTRASTHKP